MFSKERRSCTQFPSQADAIRALPHLCGEESILPEALALAPNAAARQAIERLQALYELLRVEGMTEHIILDLGEVRSMAYYTGITFHGYVEGLGTHICRGGRYDHLIANFGREMPAVGFALGVERVMLVTHLQGRIAPDLVMQGCHHPVCHALATQARAQGLRVEVDVLGRRGEELLAYGRERGARRTSCASPPSATSSADWPTR